MDNRILLAIILSIGILVLFQYLYVSYFSPQPPMEISNAGGNLTTKEISTQAPELIKTAEAMVKETKQISVTTPLYKSLISTAGARFTEFKLLNYTEDLKTKKNIELINAPKEGFPLEIYLASSPKLALIPFELGEAKSEVLNLATKEKASLPFKGQTAEWELEKIFTFHGDSYYIDLEVSLRNLTNETQRDRLLLRGVFAPFSKGSDYVFTGPFYYTDHLIEVKLKDTLSEYVGPLKYLGFMDVYFMVSLIPLEKGTFKATFRKLKEAKVHEFILWSDEFTLNPGERKTFKFKVYMGPKKAEELQKEFPLLAKSLYFGLFDLVAKPLLFLLKFFYSFTHNYGWAIVLVTFLIRILFYPLNHLSYKSMKKMQELQPLFQKLREKYKDDPQTLQKELMNLYRTHKINPFSGCLPILIQIPVFIAFYKVLLIAIELRHAPFILWINDLSSPERLYLGSLVIPYLGGIPLLTILMGASMFVQQKLTPTTMDPTQEKIMLILPIFFTILFINFPSGLVLYWFVNNLLSIGQQLVTFKLSKPK